MGFFTLELARIVGEKGKVVAIDVQKRMIESLRRRSQKARMNDRIELRLAGPAGMGVSDLVGKVDFVLAFAVAHEMPDIGQFFKESFEALKANGKLLLSEPADHIEESEFNESVSLARSAGFTMTERPQIKSNLSAVLAKSAPGKQ
jgi:ubiquinone/menaquinone biosynthesis C-methylase UbiE